MQEWMIAMFVIGIMLIVRDMAKIFITARAMRGEEALMAEENPQKARVERYAAAFRRLSDTYYGMPFRKDYLSRDQVDRVLEEANDRICSHCYQQGMCWGERMETTYQEALAAVRAMEEGEEETLRRTRSAWMGLCARAGQFLDTAEEAMQREKQNLIWDNRMIESRLAVAQQMQEIAGMMETVAEDLYDLSRAEPQFHEEVRRKLKKRHVLVRQVWMPEKTEEGRKQVFVNMRARSGQCISMMDVSLLLSEICGCPMVSARDSRSIVNGSFHTVQFQEDASYHMLHGVARITREDEQVSGDNYTCREEENGRFVMCLSDGMGSGADASRESEMVVELLEQFLDSGFSQETAARMVNSALVLRRQDGSFSTMDVCSVDLYSGLCRILKAGAASTFIKRDHWVEAISSTSLALGMVEELDFETASRKLYHGDYIIMVTDGVLDALPPEKSEETMKDIILDVKEETPKDMSREILERVLAYSDYRARDDMTVLAAGIWKK
ncbi:MAG: SpoIIE family protein phosphatase [Eubacteriales bacterium]|nr:SpoIIE family protein phosphatase [Eubacteriales bacterium]